MKYDLSIRHWLSFRTHIFLLRSAWADFGPLIRTFFKGVALLVGVVPYGRESGVLTPPTGFVSWFSSFDDPFEKVPSSEIRLCRHLQWVRIGFWSSAWHHSVSLSHRLRWSGGFPQWRKGMRSKGRVRITNDLSVRGERLNGHTTAIFTYVACIYILFFFLSLQ